MQELLQPRIWIYYCPCKGEVILLENKKYLILNCVSPKDPMEIIVEIHSHCSPSVLWINQSVQIVAMDITY